MLRNYGLEGDSVAQGLWLKSKTYFKKYYPEEVKNKAENGDIAAQWKIYLLQPVSEHLVWLCRSADQGHLLARKELGMLYLFGSEDYRKFRDFQINPDLSRSCMWLHLAGHVDITGSPISTNGLLVPTPYQSVEVERIARRLSPHQLAEAENMVVEWEAGQCQRDFSSYQSTVDLNITDIADICLDADLGSMSARETLGRKYYFGNGVPEDLKRSYMWYSLAAKVYIPPWMKAGKSQMQCDGMTSKQLSRAITLLNEWKPGKCEKGLLQ
jgi:TPR repeat protein